MTPTSLTVTEPVHVGVARTITASAARAAGLPDRIADRVVIAASELASNLVKYGAEGLFTVFRSPSTLDLLATDRGQGIRDVEQSMRDGYSTHGSLGTGLGAVRRMADVFDLYSVPGAGTTALARWRITGADPLGVTLGTALVSAPGETLSGDACTVLRHGGITTAVVVDGLGHGRDAATAAAAAIARVAADPAAAPDALFSSLDADLARTRGAAVAVAQFDIVEGTLRYQGVGNITARLYPAGGKHESLVSAPGIVGRRQLRGRRTFPSVRPWQQGSWLIMHTDGVSERWDAASWPDVFDHDPAIVAGWLLGQYCRRRDDACVLAIAGGDPL
ncbi:ATP-binding protein [Prauserella muralis]|uniref:Serine/threonine protein kinase n=1 Tax=Prauserella muralis TaxID=588067 RepID=A0A2V4ALR3_9PSEU|nr:ATP-binding protein [Prauserella muralis]PXY21235.1 serine/threonine protein kinase [Prauserella muralis]TWE30345.1 anti-sigma regulatory factor (Ser/Thr protein kinase) [Prauserella muralis]